MGSLVISALMTHGIYTEIHLRYDCGAVNVVNVSTHRMACLSIRILGLWCIMATGAIEIKEAPLSLFTLTQSNASLSCDSDHLINRGEVQ